MSTTTQEKVGDVILGAHLVRCHHETRFDPNGTLRLVRSPLKAGRGGPVTAHKRETKPGGWIREVQQKVDTDSPDPTRAGSRFRVLSVRAVPVTTGTLGGRDDGYGGGVEVTVKRLDGKGERIVYTRKCSFNTDVAEPAELVAP